MREAFESLSRDELLDLLVKCETTLRDWAYLGYNGSPFPDKERQELLTRYQNMAWEQFEKIFNKKP